MASYHPEDCSKGMINKFCPVEIRGEPVRLCGSGRPRRQFLYCDDFWLCWYRRTFDYWTRRGHFYRWIGNNDRISSLGHGVSRRSIAKKKAITLKMKGLLHDFRFTHWTVAWVKQFVGTKIDLTNNEPINKWTRLIDFWTPSKILFKDYPKNLANNLPKHPTQKDITPQS